MKMKNAILIFWLFFGWWFAILFLIAKPIKSTLKPHTCEEIK